MSSIEKQIQQLRDEIERHNHLYAHGKPEISDREFDALLRNLIDLEKRHPEFLTPNSPSQRVGGEPIDAFRTVEHAVPMMSIDNTYDESEVRAFDARVRKSLGDEKIEYVMEPKVDGVAAMLRYENGQFVLAATRGDGRRGDDITANVRTIQSVPLQLHIKNPPRVMEVQGEIYLSNAEFQRLNKAQESAGKELYKTPRNLAVGALKQLDPKITASRKLRFVAHGSGEVDPRPAESYWDWLDYLQSCRLPVTEHARRADDIDGVIRFIDEFEKLRGKLAYQTDGMVIKIDSFEQRRRLGATSKAPRWVIAYKYASEQQQTILREVDWQVGKGGTLTPVARMDPVVLGGTTVQNATLHNIDQIRKLDIHIGDTLVLEKAGEVIPYVRQSVPEKRPKDAKAIHPPRKCPSCGSETEKEADTPYIRCVNPACPAQFRERLKWFCGRNQMDIENVGEALADQLVDSGLVKTFADLYRLEPAQLIDLERMAEKSAQNVIDAIAASRSRGLDRLLAGLGIRHVGNRVASVLATHFQNLPALESATVESLSAVHEIGEVIAQSVHDFFHSPAGKKAIEALKSAGINPQMEAPKRSADQPLANQTIVVTGTLEGFSRQEIESLIVELGGRVSGNVSKKTAFVLAGADPGSKRDKALSLGVAVLDEREFLVKIGRK